MDLHILIVIACVFFASLFSLLFINKFFRRKTFEEIIAEKRAHSERVHKAAAAALKKPKKPQQPTKKDQKREKQRQQQQRSKLQQSEEESNSELMQEEQQTGLSKLHVEFEPDPEILNYNSNSGVAATVNRRSSQTDKEQQQQSGKLKTKKDKKNTVKTGILINKHEPVAVKQQLDEATPANHFEQKHPKDIVELKKIEEAEKKQLLSQQNGSTGKKEKQQQQLKKTVAESAAVPVKQQQQQQQQQQQKTENIFAVANSPKSQRPKAAKKQNQNQKDLAANKELLASLDKLSEKDTISVTLLMNLFRRAELNRSEIQILIDSLLNRQQDLPNIHSEWSDDICQKLKRQLEEKERQLQEEQEAAMGLKDKMRDLRAEINGERLQINAANKINAEKIALRDQEIAGLTQELQALNEKFSLERQQFQAQLLREKQLGTQEVVGQMQLMQNDLAQKDNYIGELTMMLNASRQALDESQQKNDIIQQQQQQIVALEQQRDELEQISNNRCFDLEKLKELETQLADHKLEGCNLQNALESVRADLEHSYQELEDLRAQLKYAQETELPELQQQVHDLKKINAELIQQLNGYSNQTEEQTKEQANLQLTINALQTQLADREQTLTVAQGETNGLQQQLNAVEATASHKQREFEQLTEALKTDLASKHQQLQEATQTAQKFDDRERELLQQLHEQKEKNNQQQQLLAATQKPSATATATTNTTASDSPKDQQHIRDLFQRLYPNAVKACASTALSLSFDAWIDQVITTHIKQLMPTTAAIATTTNANGNSSSSANTATQTSGSSNNHNSHNSHTNNNNNNNNNHDKTHSSEDSNTNCRTNSNNNNTADGTANVQKLEQENTQLRIQREELRNIVTKTNNSLLEIERSAREKDAYWRGIVSDKEAQILKLQQHLNGEHVNLQ